MMLYICVCASVYNDDIYLGIYLGWVLYVLSSIMRIIPLWRIEFDIVGKGTFGIRQIMVWILTSTELVLLFPHFLGGHNSTSLLQILGVLHKPTYLMQLAECCSSFSLWDNVGLFCKNVLQRGLMSETSRVKTLSLVCPMWKGRPW